MCFHPEEESIVVLTTEKVMFLMDIHAHTLVSEFKIAELYDGDPIFSGWYHRKVVEKFIDSKLESEIKKLIKRNKNYKKFLRNQRYNTTKLSSKFKNLNHKYQKDINPNYIYVSYI